MKFLHVSKELHSEPVYALGTDGKPDVSRIVSYRFVLYRGDGKTYVRNPPKQPSRRDLHRARR